MNGKDFLKLVWPDQGFYCIAMPNATRTGYRHRVFATLDDAYSEARSLYQQVDMYFCIHTHIEQYVYSQKFGRNIPSRKKENMRAARTFFLDLDVGKGTKEKPKYANQQDALSALSKFIFQSALPRPYVVSSGNGLHVYWPFQDEVDSADWRGHASNLRLLLDKHGVLYDPSRTTDITSILRLPGTLNLKDPSAPKKVAILFEGDPPADNSRLFGWIALATAGLQPIKLSAGPSGGPVNITPGLLGFPPTDPDDVAAECEQMRIFRDSSGNISERHWYDGLGVLGYCTNGRATAHKWSSGHPNYSPQETDAKFNQWTANASVTSCNTLGSNGVPGVCQRCPHFGGPHKNPIVIVNKKPLTQAFVAQAPTVQQFNPPPPPHPYKRLTGLSVVRDDPKGLPIPVMSGADLYPISTSSGVIDGMKINNGVSKWVAREHDATSQILTIVFDVPNELLSDPKAMSVHFSAHGLYHPATTEVVRYMSAYLKELKRHAGMAQQHAHLGWPGKDDLSRFTLNGKSINQKGEIELCTMAPQTRIVTESMTQGGTLQGQIEALKFYNDPAYAAQQFFILASISAPLFMATGHHGLVINMSGESSAGKTTALKAAAGMWGDPAKFMVNGTARGMSAMARDARAMAIPNLPTCIDEITHMEPDDARATVMGAPQAKLRETLTGDRQPREKVTGYRGTPMLTTGNNSLHQLVNQQSSAAGTAASARVIELLADIARQIHTKDEADAANHLFSTHFGWLGEYMLTLAMPCMDHLFDSVTRMMTRLNNTLLARGVERFVIAGAAPPFVMGAFLVYHGVIEWDMNALYDWYVNEQHPALRAQMKAQALSVAPVTILNDFLAENVMDTIETNPANPQGIGPVQIRNQVVVHKRPDLKEVWVSLSSFKEWCGVRGIAYDNVVADLTKRGIVMRQTRKYMGEGTKYQSGFNRALVLDPAKI